jgi:hypothetical protein
MSNRRRGTTFGLLTALALCLAANVSWAQEALVVKLDPTGMIHVMRGAVELTTVELNSHGVAWKNAPQSSATAQVSDLPPGGKRFVGTLPIPDTAGGALQFVETVKPMPKGLALEWDVSLTKAMKLNGLQVSIGLLAAPYLGKALTIGQPEGDPITVLLPTDKPESVFYGWSGAGERVEAGKGSPDAVAIQLRAATDIVVQDLRKWNHPVFEVRFPAFNEDGGRDIAVTDRFHLDLILSFAAPVTLSGP